MYNTCIISHQVLNSFRPLDDQVPDSIHNLGQFANDLAIPNTASPQDIKRMTEEQYSLAASRTNLLHMIWRVIYDEGKGRGGHANKHDYGSVGLCMVKVLCIISKTNIVC